jgi:hypothetical protein
MPALALEIVSFATKGQGLQADWYGSRRNEKYWVPSGKGKESAPKKENEAHNAEQTAFAQHGLAAISEYLNTYKAIEQSRYIGQLQNDWNEEGAEGYSVLTWQRTAYFVAAQVSSARNAGLSIGVPTIAPADEGSIDIHWQNKYKNLLINVPADPNKHATFYGSSKNGETTSGVLDTRAPRPDLLQWLNATV